jgi:copper ion binding protein
MKTKLNVTGMSCAHCVKHVTEALEGVAGVKSAKVSLKSNSAEVKFDAPATIDAMCAAVKDAGYEAAEAA